MDIEETNNAYQRVMMRYPKSIEELMIHIGEKEQNSDVQIIMTVQLIADISTRIVRLENKQDA